MERVARAGRAAHRPVQLLGVEHHRRVAHGAHRERQHAHHPGCNAQSATVHAGLQPVRAEPGSIGPDGGTHAALPSGVLPGRRLRPVQVVMPAAVHSHYTGVSRLHIQHYCHRGR